MNDQKNFPPVEEVLDAYQSLQEDYAVAMARIKERDERIRQLEALRKDAERAAYAADNAAAPTAATGVEVVAVPHGFLSDVLTAAGLLWSGGRCKALGERLSDAYSQIRATDLDAMREDRDAAHEVLRSLACWLSVGGYNAEEVNAAEFERKIRDGVDMLTAPLTQQIDALRARLEQAESRTAELISHLLYFPELNMNNYDEDQVRDLNDWGIAAFKLADAMQERQS